MSKSQINLPKTAFSMKANLPIREPEILELWKKIDLYKELRNSRKGEGKLVSSGWLFKGKSWKITEIDRKINVTNKLSASEVVGISL